VSALLMFIACGGNAADPAVTDLPEIDSGGLGLTRAQWEAKVGPLSHTSTGSGFSNVGVDSSAFVAFTKSGPDGFGRVRSVELHILGRLTEDESRAAALTFLPRDSKHIFQTTDCRACRFWVTTDRFSSVSLAALQNSCTGPLFKSSPPGEVSIAIRTDTGSRSTPPALVEIYWSCDSS
jgi:hypothetical protein